MRYFWATGALACAFMAGANVALLLDTSHYEASWVKVTFLLIGFVICALRTSAGEG